MVFIWEIYIVQQQFYMTFRSIEMAHFRLFLPRENFYQSIQQLLYLGNVHIVDIGNPISRPFYPQIKRCDQLHQKINSIIEAMKEKKIKIQQYDQQDPNYIEQLSEFWHHQTKTLGVEKAKLLDHYENQIIENWQKFNEKRNSIEKLITNQKSVLAKMACFEALQRFFGQGRNIGDLGIGGSSGISIMVGVIDPVAQLKLSRTIYRISRGFAFMKSIDQFNFHALKDFGQKAIILVYPNSTTGVLQKKLARVMETYCNSLIQFQEGDQPQLQMNRSRHEYDEVMNILSLNEKQMQGLLQSLKKRKCLEAWRTFIWKEKAIYESLNKMQLREHYIISQAYIPKSERFKLDSRIKMITPSPQFQEMEVIKPPTAFDTNSYTKIAQEIINTYGVPRYQEINPSIFTTVTFPFFFGVMFGDIGHGLVLLVLGLYLVFFNDKIKKTSFAFASDLRYIVLMMGFFAFYCGWIYNDFLGMNLNIFGSCYTPIQAEQYVSPKPDCVYPFGIDPIWGVSGNELVFVNALKMKISVIIAIVHMSLGVCIKCFNALYFKKKMDVFFEFIPQILFLVLLFGYMDFLIIFKWLTKWNCSINAAKTGIECLEPLPPSIISTMMDIGLQVGSTSKAGSMWGQKGNSTQDIIQVLILVVAFISIPIMLLPKPIIQIRGLKKHKKENPLLEALQHNDIDGRLINNSEDFDIKDKEQMHADHDHGKQHDPSQIFVHQLIQTIEFVLGAISNTASYLRLWALSLAHSQLAKVFFSKTLQAGFTFQSGPLAFIAMPVLFYMLVWVTFGVLMCMDTMECFLHSLRLHWVQFQNKFYKGDGYQYEPIAFKKYLLEMKSKSNE